MVVDKGPCLIFSNVTNFSLEQAPVGQLPWSGWQIELYSLYRKGFGDFMTEVEKCQLID